MAFILKNKNSKRSKKNTEELKTDSKHDEIICFFSVGPFVSINDI